jgi:hypothetical protein
MTQDASGEDAARRAYLREVEEVRREFRVASYEVWIGLASLLARRWDSPALARRIASGRVQVLSDLSRLRCLPDGRPLPASEVLDCLHEDVTRDGKTPAGVVERKVVRDLAGEPRSTRTPAEVTALIEAFLRCYAADYERGELTWVDELYALAVSGEPAATWTLEVPPTYSQGEDTTVTLRIPLAALEAAGLLVGDQLILEPRSGGLWIGRGPRPFPAS